MKISEIFTPGRFPTWTYVDDHLRAKEQQLKDTLDDGSMLVSISGPSKSGKTVFVEKALGKENLIQVTGAGTQSPEALWMKVFDIIGTPIHRTVTSGSTLSGSTSGKVSGSGNAVIAKVEGEASMGAGWERQNSTSDVSSIDCLQLLIRELSGTEYVIFIDDFHYIERSIQSEIAKQIKEAIRQGVKFICASVPYHSDDVIRSNPDLRGRLFSIDFDYWGDEVLKKIAEKGADKANFTFDEELTFQLVGEAAGSPQLMQYLCLNACYDKGIRNICTDTKELIYSAEFLKSICRRTIPSADYSSIAEKMLEGPKQRGSNRKIYFTRFGWQGDVYRILIKAISLDPPRLNFRDSNLKSRIADTCSTDTPSGSSITSACQHVASIANASAGNNIVEWDSENDVFDIRDPYLLFYLRWSDINEH